MSNTIQLESLHCYRCNKDFYPKVSPDGTIKKQLHCPYCWSVTWWKTPEEQHESMMNSLSNLKPFTSTYQIPKTSNGKSKKKRTMKNFCFACEISFPNEVGLTAHNNRRHPQKNESE